MHEGVSGGSINMLKGFAVYRGPGLGQFKFVILSLK